MSLFDSLLQNNDILSVMVRKSCFSLCFCGFLKGPTLDPLAPAQSKHRFSFLAWALQLLCFSYNFMHIPGTFGIEIGPEDIKNRA